MVTLAAAKADSGTAAIWTSAIAAASALLGAVIGVFGGAWIERQRERRRRKRLVYAATVNVFHQYVHALSQWVIHKTEPKQIKLEGDWLAKRVVDTDYSALAQSGEMQIYCPEGMEQYKAVQQATVPLREHADAVSDGDDPAQVGVEEEPWKSLYMTYHKEAQKLAALAPK
ncbi:hypothetical protein [Streptomyces sp. NPDC046870]|uniref:hypothetical protein n=1 Tax=Streptomyces sp. NPDC046870 TaxID=3155135 RepID=UPI003451FCA1